MADPPRPELDEPITSAWGSAVHDKVFVAVPVATVNWTGTLMFAADGTASVTIGALGLSLITGAVANVNQGTAAIPVFCNAIVSTDRTFVTIVGFSMPTATTVQKFASGNVKLSVIAWGTPL